MDKNVEGLKRVQDSLRKRGAFLLRAETLSGGPSNTNASDLYFYSVPKDHDQETGGGVVIIQHWPESGSISVYTELKSPYIAGMIEELDQW